MGILQIMYSSLIVAATFGQTSSQSLKNFLCRDDESFKFRGDSEKDCNKWARKKNKNKQRCQLGGGRVAKACKFSCNTCECVDDPNFFFKDESQTCKKWVAKVPEMRCRKNLKRVNGVARSKVSDHCRILCGTCRPPDCIGEMWKKTAETFSKDSGKIVSDRGKSSYFGWSNAIVQSTMAVGALRNNSDRGAVYLYQKISDGVWELQEKLEASDGTADDWFGVSVAMSDHFLVVGAPSGRDRSGGSAYVYARGADGSLGPLVQKLRASDGQRNDEFGWTVGVSDRIIVVGNNGVGSNGGKIYFFEPNSTGTWEEVLVDTSDYTFSVSKDLVVSTLKNEVRIYSPAIIPATSSETSHETSSENTRNTSSATSNENTRNTSSETSNEISVKTSKKNEDDYKRAKNKMENKKNDNSKTDNKNYSAKKNKMGNKKNNYTNKGTWELTQQVNIEFGSASSVYLSDNTIAVGLSELERQTGAVTILTRRDGVGWERTQQLVASDGQEGAHFGARVAIMGNMLVVGAYSNDNKNGEDAGAVYLFSVRGEGDGAYWTEVKKVVTDDGREWDGFGWDISASAGTIVIGAPDDDDSKGSVYVIEPDCI